MRCIYWLLHDNRRWMCRTSSALAITSTRAEIQVNLHLLSCFPILVFPVSTSPLSCSLPPVASPISSNA
ncbi:hypothetical protein V2G26_004970 [Clonostachys chloroleuca]